MSCKINNRDELQKQLKDKEKKFDINLPLEDKLKILDKVDEKFTEYLIAMTDAGYSQLAYNHFNHNNRYRKTLLRKDNNIIKL